MLIKEVYIPTSSLKVSLSFYSRVFDDVESYREDGLVSLSSGITLCTESLWSELYGVGSDLREKGVLGINLIFETRNFDLFLHHLKMLKDKNSIIYKPLENKRGRLQITLIDPDMNLVTVRESIQEEALLGDEKRTISIQNLDTEHSVFFQENSVDDCVND